MSALICGSLTYDTIMEFHDKFKHHLSPVQIHSLDVYFTVPDLRRQFGGSAGNVAYNLKMLGADPLPMATVGTDFCSYAEWLETCGIRRDYIMTIEHCYTAQNFITIDMDDNHMTAFHPGAMSFSHHNKVSQVQNARVGAVCSENPEGMMAHALQFGETGIPFVFYPGQSITEFDGTDLLRFVEQASWILVNREEWEFMGRQVGLTPQQLSQRIQALIIMQQAEGPVIYTPDTYYQIPPAQVNAVNDPSSCGDAFCAGLLYGLLKEADWETTGRISTLMGAIKVEHHGSQSHFFTLDHFKTRFRKNFGYALII